MVGCELDGVVTAAPTGASNPNRVSSGAVPLAPTCDPTGVIVQAEAAYVAQL